MNTIQYKNLIFQGFLESEGIVVNPAGSAPSDPYIHKRQEAAKLRGYKTKTDFDALRQFLEMDRKVRLMSYHSPLNDSNECIGEEESCYCRCGLQVLRFFCVWDDRDQMFGEIRKFILHVSKVILSTCILIYMQKFKMYFSYVCYRV